jgi:hypothetical protein
VVELGEPDVAYGGSPMRRFVEIDGKRHLWRDLLKLRRQQRDEERKAQLALFELKDDRRPASVVCGSALLGADAVQNRLSPSGALSFFCLNSLLISRKMRGIEVLKV